MSRKTATVLLWITGAQALDSIAYLERSDSAWGPYIFPVMSAAPVAAALMILQALAILIREIADRGEPAAEATPPPAPDDEPH